MTGLLRLFLAIVASLFKSRAFSDLSESSGIPNPVAM